MLSSKTIITTVRSSYPIVRSRAMRSMSDAVGEEYLIQEHIQEERHGTRIERQCLAARDTKHKVDEIMALCGFLEEKHDRLREEADHPWIELEEDALDLRRLRL